MQDSSLALKAAIGSPSAVRVNTVLTIAMQNPTSRLRLSICRIGSLRRSSAAQNTPTTYSPFLLACKFTYRWFKCAGLGSGAQLVAKELGSSPSLSLSGLQGSCINCEVTLTVNGKSKTIVPKAICNGKLSDGIYVRPRIG